MSNEAILYFLYQALCDKENFRLRLARYPKFIESMNMMFISDSRIAVCVKVSEADKRCIPYELMGAEEQERAKTFLERPKLCLRSVPKIDPPLLAVDCRWSVCDRVDATTFVEDLSGDVFTGLSGYLYEVSKHEEAYRDHLCFDSILLSRYYLWIMGQLPEVQMQESTESVNHPVGFTFHGGWGWVMQMAPGKSEEQV